MAKHFVESTRLAPKSRKTAARIMFVKDSRLAQLRPALRAVMGPVRAVMVCHAHRLDIVLSRSAHLARREGLAPAGRRGRPPSPKARASGHQGNIRRPIDQLVVHRGQGSPTRLAKNEYAPAVRGGRLGKLLAAAARAPAVRVPSTFASERSAIARLSSRLHAFGLHNPLTSSDLPYFSPSQLRHHLERARDIGLLDEGPGWTYQAAAARTCALDLNRDLWTSAPNCNLKSGQPGMQANAAAEGGHPERYDASPGPPQSPLGLRAQVIPLQGCARATHAECIGPRLQATGVEQNLTTGPSTARADNGIALILRRQDSDLPPVDGQR
ncbi:MAG: hypothetical protein ABSB49_11910 [Polyangia bacterium]|jgi:hypothetical protein